MTIRPASIPGLPENLVVRRSDRRRKSVSATVEAGVTIVVVPQRMSNSQARQYALELHEKITQGRRSLAAATDSDLAARALILRDSYFPNSPLPTRIVWSTRQNRRCGSCTPSASTIRISERLKSMPRYVLDYVILHELAHLVFSNHGTEFEALLGKYPEVERARAFLAGYEHASAEPPTLD